MIKTRELRLLVAGYLIAGCCCNGSEAVTDSGDRAKGKHDTNSARAIESNHNLPMAAGQSDGASARAKPPEAIKAEGIAIEHVRRMRMVPKQYDISSRKYGHVWYVTIERIPKTPGAHTLVVVDQFGRVVKVSAGR